MRYALSALARFGAAFLLAFCLTTALLPVGWMLISSLKTNAEFFLNPLGLPKVLTLQNYYTVFFYGGRYGEEPLMRFLVNSILASGGATVLGVLVASMASFAFLFPMKRRKVWYYVLSFGLFVPTSAFMVPYFIIIRTAGLYDTVAGLALVYAGMFVPLSFLIISTYMRENVPQQLIEASMLDGASIHRCFLQIVLPLSRGGLLTATVFLFINSWNELLYALLLTQSERARTIQVAISSLVATYAANYPAAFAAVIVSITPIIIVVTISGKYILKGLGVYVEK